MSGIISATVGIPTALTAIGIYSGEKSQRLQAKAQKQNIRQARETAKLQEEAMNKANARQPDIAAILSAAQQAQKSGMGSTMLTGSRGVDPSSLVLGRKTLLGA